jgi:hypothetical protein
MIVDGGVRLPWGSTSHGDRAVRELVELEFTAEVVLAFPVSEHFLVGPVGGSAWLWPGRAMRAVCAAARAQGHETCSTDGLALRLGVRGEWHPLRGRSFGPWLGMQSGYEFLFTADANAVWASRSTSTASNCSAPAFTVTEFCAWAQRVPTRHASAFRPKRRPGHSRRTRHAAREAAVGARHHASGLALDFTALRARRALGASQRAARARFTDDAAVVIEAGEGALAAGGAGAAAVRAFAGAARVVALATDVTRRRHAQERAGAPGAAATLAVGAGAAARGTVAVDVARRSGAAEAAAAVVAAGAVAVGAGAGAVVVVALAHDGARWCGAVEVTRVSRVAHAAPAVAVVVVIAAGSERRGKTEQKGDERDSDRRSGEHGARALHGRASRQWSQLAASYSPFAGTTRARAARSRHSAAPRSRPSWRRSCLPP